MFLPVSLERLELDFSLVDFLIYTRTTTLVVVLLHRLALHHSSASRSSLGVCLSGAGADAQHSPDVPA